MTRQEAVNILMLSPFYFRMSPGDRINLLKEFCRDDHEIKKNESRFTEK
ncbi:MAG: hypothetical protein KKB30_15120 [Proteobacteria bacterium]|nr:hypothetical protein [Pseudomonadota bacterium]MBU1716255.1 hypothetical protein [Pseudomonadota bacterium]